jgi:hypothetical protein
MRPLAWTITLSDHSKDFELTKFFTAILAHKKGAKEAVIHLHVINYGIM